MAGYAEKYRGRLKLQPEDSQPESPPVAYSNRPVVSFPLLQALSETVDSVQTQLAAAEERIVQLTRLVKLQQSVAENQDEEIGVLKATVEALRCSQFEQASKMQAVQAPPARQPQVELASDFANCASFGRPEQFQEFAPPVDEDRVSGLERLYADLREKLTAQATAMKQVMEAAFNAENVCLKVSEECFAKIEAVEQRFHLFQPDSLHMSELEEKVADKLGATLEKVAGTFRSYAKRQEQLEADFIKITESRQLGQRSASVNSLRRTNPAPLKTVPADRPVSPRATAKSKAMEASIKQKLLQMRLSEKALNERRQGVKSEVINS